MRRTLNDSKRLVHDLGVVVEKRDIRDMESQVHSAQSLAEAHKGRRFH